MEKITSLQNAKVKQWMRLHEKKYRDETGLFLVEGDHLYQEAKAAGCIRHVLVDDENLMEQDSDILVTPAILEKLSKNVSHVHRISICQKPNLATSKPSRIVIVEDVQDPGNLGAILRSVVAFGYDALYCTKHSVDAFNEKVIRASQGAIFQVPIIYEDIDTILKRLKSDGFVLYATSLHDACPMKTIAASEKMAFIFGNEGSGVQQATIAKVDGTLYIEMAQFESLNVAVAAGIVLYRFSNRI